MKIMVIDTETTSLEKPFIYNVGYLVADEKGEKFIEREYVIEQIWHNLPLFSTAYYAEKRQFYVEEMRARHIVLDKFGYVMRQIMRDIRDFGVEAIYAYNSPFDDKAISFNCDWFKCSNPTENIPFLDIRGAVHAFLISDKYREFCDKNSLFTESGNYSSTAEAVYRFISQDENFIESHTALSDSQIEYQILLSCVKRGAILGENYAAKRSIERVVEKELKLIDKEQNEHRFKYSKIWINKERTKISLK